MKCECDNVCGEIIGEVDHYKVGQLINSLTGETVERSPRMQTDKQVREWAGKVINERKNFWGSDYQKRYSKGFDLMIYDY